jgi:hypothetical protein
MAKQTFTTGQVLTAAQMTSLQQTAMGGGSATAKTASYVLVAADAGGTVAMNAAGATTITVNTALFAAGDTVFIQNLGAGNCVVTAGTATVSTAGSLTLPQYDAGILYFTATGAAIFYDYVQGGGSASPLTTKGDLYTYSTIDARLPVGTNTYVLTANSAEATGLKWTAPAGGAGLTLIDEIPWTSSTTLNCDNVFTSTYKNYRILIVGKNVADNQAIGATFKMRASGTATSSGYQSQRIYADATTVGTSANPAGTDEWFAVSFSGNDRGNNGSFLDLFYPYESSYTSFWASGFNQSESAGLPTLGIYGGALTNTTSYDGIGFIAAVNITATVFIYGYAKE